jgi:hypothetical protein
MRSFLVVVLTLALITCAASYFLGCWTFSTEREDGGLRVTLHLMPWKGAEAAEDRAKRISESIKERVEDLKGAEKVMGFVNEVTTSGEEFTMTTSDNRVLTIHRDPTTRVTGSLIRGLMPGDRVTVTFTAKDGVLIARSITTE